MAFYDRIAKKWHALTGSRGGAFKRFVLNELVLNALPDIAGLAILELGAGNGYFMPLVLRRFSGQVPARIVITDQSQALLDVAQRNFRVPAAEYRILDVRRPVPFTDSAFDLIVSNMVFNELNDAGLRCAVGECGRVLVGGGRLVATVTHPAFVDSLLTRGQLRQSAHGVPTMPGSDGLRLPAVPRSTAAYQAAFQQAGFKCRAQDVYATEQVLRAKRGLLQAGKVPLALLFECEMAAPP